VRSDCAAAAASASTKLTATRRRGRTPRADPNEGRVRATSAATVLPARLPQADWALSQVAHVHTSFARSD